MKQIIIAIVVILLAVGGYMIFKGPSSTSVVNEEKDKMMEDNMKNDLEMTRDRDDQMMEEENKPESVIGKSVDGIDIVAYHYGTGDDEILLVGGIHGGYSWNTSLVAFETMDYLADNPDVIPDNVKVTVIPVLNPDGLNEVVGKSGRFEKSDVPSSQAETINGRFNSNNVDLNRNFDCDWQSEGVWQSKKVSGGDSAFSEPESQAIKSYVESHNLKAVIVWYSSAGSVFSSSCHNGVLDETKTLTNLYAKASGYKAYEEFDFYDITGDMVNWLAREGIPAISVLLTNHTNTEWSKNKLGINAVLDYYANNLEDEIEN